MRNKRTWANFGLGYRFGQGNTGIGQNNRCAVCPNSFKIGLSILPCYIEGYGFIKLVVEAKKRKIK